MNLCHSNFATNTSFINLIPQPLQNDICWDDMEHDPLSRPLAQTQPGSQVPVIAPSATALQRRNTSGSSSPAAHNSAQPYSTTTLEAPQGGVPLPQSAGPCLVIKAHRVRQQGGGVLNRLLGGGGGGNLSGGNLMVRLTSGVQSTSCPIGRKGAAPQSTAGLVVPWGPEGMGTASSGGSSAQLRVELVGQSGLQAEGVIAMAKLCHGDSPEASGGGSSGFDDDLGALEAGVVCDVALFSLPDGKSSRSRAGCIELFVQWRPTGAEEMLQPSLGIIESPQPHASPQQHHPPLTTQPSSLGHQPSYFGPPAGFRDVGQLGKPPRIDQGAPGSGGPGSSSRYPSVPSGGPILPIVGDKAGGSGNHVLRMNTSTVMDKMLEAALKVMVERGTSVLKRLGYVSHAGDHL